MRLELRKAHVTGLEWGSPTRMENGVLYVDKAGLIAALSDDDRIEKWDVDLARPGESVRIIPVKDVIEPRVKLEGGESYFASVIGPNDTAGEGATFVLDGAGVVTVGPIMGFQEGFIDMSGPAAKFSPFAGLFNVVLIAQPVKDLEKHQYEEAIRIGGLKAAVWLADCCKDAKIDATEVFEKGTVAEELKKYPDLPPVVHLCMCITQGLLHDTYVYGADVKTCLPTLLHPNEVLDGAMVSGNCVSACDKTTTWHHLHDPVVSELYAQHGKTVNFLGMIPTQESVVLAGKERASSFNARLCRELGAKGVIITEEGYGNPDSDLCLNVNKCEALGMSTVVIADEASGTDGASQGLADATPQMTAFVSCGNVNEMLEVPAMKKVIGFIESIAHVSGGAAESLRPDGSMYVELQSIIGSTCETGFNKSGSLWV
ncbi:MULTISPECIES: glycine/sarcosine/betaine reductase component B subunit [unclassified Pyramidobacter]|uniref:glycine/sarcosine/betaine reductase component B subunit n=1 Tax=unclassified Pyramidobacter TaxID=2632171 RepID=UPI00098F51E3|nr:MULTISPECIES: glycine/sarcosine/betaine reductase component B subunit [unclassified Pyramidobacter]MCI7402504.1 glycine/sarcosine/betaine reductase component B subunit [Pyramidobacter sp.]MDY3212815.1 glycine/sarcosine/betaine reductase component B subunit [Pyramidobacter sp.]OON87338.1 beta-aspartyl-peptidase [Pyramidobacter sp. C12-8]RKJ78263.1 beta-aspartyl-peptidase [Pyramidobacter sp. CG50-2]WOL40116.1 glycine/sarcosine/betaine reductase component B subunit [Pyramidobacter sp. YE332]